jgi:hypothetical protein
METNNNWLILNKSYGFGSGRVYQSECNKTASEILSEFVNTPSRFLDGGDCFNKFTGKVTSNECTKELKAGIASIHVKKDEIKVGFGSGAMLGGLDKELTYTKTDELTCKKIQDIESQIKDLSAWWRSRNIPDSLRTELDKRNLTESLKECEELRGEKPMILERSEPIRKCVEKFKSNQSPTQISEKVECPGLDSAYRFSGTLEDIIAKKLTLKETVVRELGSWNRKISDIKTVHYERETPFLITTNQGEQIIIAPRIESDYCDQLEDRIIGIINDMRYKLEAKQKEIYNNSVNKCKIQEKILLNLILF